MTDVADILAELLRVRDALLSPALPALNDCERKLSRIVEAIRQSGREFPKSAEADALIRSIHALLENAKRFWNAWGRVPHPGQQYSPGGSLLPTDFRPTFVVEL